jgi:hypothetical protein
MPIRLSKFVFSLLIYIILAVTAQAQAPPQDNFYGREDVTCPAPTHRVVGTFSQDNGTPGNAGLVRHFIITNATIVADPNNFGPPGIQDYDVTISSPPLSFRIGVGEPMTFGGTGTSGDYAYDSTVQTMGDVSIATVSLTPPYEITFSPDPNTLRSYNIPSTAGWMEPGRPYNPFSQSTSIGAIVTTPQFTISTPYGNAVGFCDPQHNYVYMEAVSGACVQTSAAICAASYTLASGTVSGGTVTLTSNTPLPAWTVGPPASKVTIEGTSDPQFSGGLPGPPGTQVTLTAVNNAAGTISWSCPSVTDTSSVGGSATFGAATPYPIISITQSGHVCTAIFSVFQSIGLGAPVTVQNTVGGTGTWNRPVNITAIAGNTISYPAATESGSITSGKGSVLLNGYVTWPTRYTSTAIASFEESLRWAWLGGNAIGEDSDANIQNGISSYATNAAMLPTFNPAGGTVISPTIYAGVNNGGRISQPIHNITGSVTHQINSTLNFPISILDYLDPNYFTYCLQQFGSAGTPGGYKTMSAQGMIFDDGDNTHVAAAGAQFWGVENTGNGQGQGQLEHAGWLMGIASPHITAEKTQTYTSATNAPYFFPNDEVYSKTLTVTASGTVSTSGTSVTATSGTFSTSWRSGTAITIHGTGYNIANVSSPTSLTLATSAGTQTGVSFSVVAPTCSLTTPCSWPDYARSVYGTIGALNTAYGSNYSTFGSNETKVTGFVVGTGNGTTTNFTCTLSSTGTCGTPSGTTGNVSPGSIHFYLEPASTPIFVSGDCPTWVGENYNQCATPPSLPAISGGGYMLPPPTKTLTAIRVAAGWFFQDANYCIWQANNAGTLSASVFPSVSCGLPNQVSGGVTFTAIGPALAPGGTITYASGVLNVTFAFAPPVGYTILADFTQCGFATTCGTGLEDEDGTGVGCQWACGTATSSGSTITFSSGTNFVTGGAWVGLPIKLNGIVAHISSVNSSTSITTTAPVATHASPVSFVVNGFGNNDLCVINPPVWTTSTSYTANTQASIVRDPTGASWWLATSTGTSGSNTLPASTFSTNPPVAVTFNDGGVNWVLIGAPVCNTTNGAWKVVIDAQQTLAQDLTNYLGEYAAQYFGTNHEAGQLLAPDAIQMGPNFGLSAYDIPTYAPVLQADEMYSDAAFLGAPFPYITSDSRGLGVNYDPIGIYKYNYVTSYYNKPIVEENFLGVSAGWDSKCFTGGACPNSLVGMAEQYYDRVNLALNTHSPNGILQSAGQTFWGNMHFQGDSFGYLDFSGNAMDGHENVNGVVPCSFDSTKNCGSEVVGVPWIGVDMVNCTGQPANNCIKAANSLWLTPSQPVVLVPSPFTFASQFVGTSSPAASLTLFNGLSSTISISSINVTSAGGFSADFPYSIPGTGGCGSTLAPSTGCTINGIFTPSSAVAESASLNVTYAGGGGGGGTAASCNASDVAAAIASATEGQTVTIPAGSCTWTGSQGVTVSGKGIAIQGAGSGRIIAIDNNTEVLTVATGTLTVNIGQYSPGFSAASISNGETLRIVQTNYNTNWMQGTVTSLSGSVLTMNITSTNGSGAASNQRWYISTVPTNQTVITDNSSSVLFTLAEDTAFNTSLSGIKFLPGSAGNFYVQLNYTAGGLPILIHDNWIVPSSFDSVNSGTDRGVMWNNTCEGNSASVNLTTTSCLRVVINSPATGVNDAWNHTAYWGASDTTGTNNFYFETNDVHVLQAASDNDSNGRLVWRYNQMDTSAFSTHGADSSSYGQRYFEFYNNYGNYAALSNGFSFNLANGWVGLIRGGSFVIHDNTLPVIAGSDYPKNDLNVTVMNLQRNAGYNPCWGAGWGTHGQYYYAPRQVGIGNVTGTGTTNFPPDSCTNCTHDSGGIYVGDLESGYIWNNSRSPLTISTTDYGTGSADSCPSSPTPDSSAYYLNNAQTNYFNGTTAKPGYTPYTYPHPLTAGSGGTVSSILNGTGLSTSMVSVSPSTYCFNSCNGWPAGGGNSPDSPVTFTVTNPSGGTITVGTPTLSDSTDFSIAVNSCTTVANGGTCTITVNFSPSSSDIGTLNSILTIPYTGASGSPITVALSGVSTSVSISPNSYGFLPTISGTQSADSPQPFAIQNQSSSTVTITSISVGTANFTVTNPNSCATIAAASQCIVEVYFNPTALGVLNDTLTVVYTGAAGSPATSGLSGTGLQYTAPPAAAIFNAKLKNSQSQQQQLVASLSGFGFALPIAPSAPSVGVTF